MSIRYLYITLFSKEERGTGFFRVSYFCSHSGNICPDINGGRNSENTDYSERKTLSQPQPRTGPAADGKTTGIKRGGVG
jgi:hypothetical protein